MRTSKIVTAIGAAAAVALTAGLVAVMRCGGEPPDYDERQTHITSYRDIPGISAEEIAAIAAIRENRGRVVYENRLISETPDLTSGIAIGYAAEFFQFFSDFFNIEFVSNLAANDANETEPSDETAPPRAAADIAYGIVNTPTTAERYFMTSPVAGTRMSIFARAGVPPLRRMNELAGMRIGYLENGPTGEIIERYYPNLNIEHVPVPSLAAAADALRDSAADLFMSGLLEAEEFFAKHEFVNRLDPFTPLYVPIAIGTADPELRPLISVLNRYLNEAGGFMRLSVLHKRGQVGFLRAKLHMSLTEDERKYLEAALAESDGAVSVGFMHDAYPASFYNRVEDEYQGIAPDILREVTQLTGLRFVETVTDNTTSLAGIVARVRDGSISMATHLLYTESRRDDFLWSDFSYLSSRFALLSRIDFPRLEKFQVYYHTVGVVGGSVHAERFEQWFPDHRHTVVYATGGAAFDALAAGEVDLIMLAENMLWAMTNYYGEIGYRVNIAFNEMQEARIGYGRDEIHLRSIVDKAMALIEIENIRDYWVNRAFDYSKEILRQRVLYMYVIVGVAVTVLIAVSFMYRKNRKLSIILRQESARSRKAEARAAEASDEKSKFLANMSHEIRTPLNAIVGMSELLMLEQMEEHQHNYVKDISTASHSLLSIVNDILDISKIEAGRFELARENYSLYAFVENLISMFRFMANRKGLQLDVDEYALKSLPACVCGDEIKLRQVLVNLCANAVNYTNEGRVKLRAAATASELTFEISDTGCGIREQDHDKLFIPFRRMNEGASRNVQGTGLGLPISKKFVEMMGGRLEFKSVFGKGSTFTVIIPRVDGDPAKITRAEAAAGAKIKFKAPGAKILVVDDNQMNLKVASRLLGLFAVSVDLVSSGEEAIRAVQIVDYHIVFMDHMMPEMDGIEAAHRIRELGGRCEKLPIIALTANATHGVREIFLSSGLDDYLSKPIEIDTLADMLKKWLPAKLVGEIGGDSLYDLMYGAAAPESESANNAEPAAAPPDDIWSAVGKIGYVNVEVAKGRVAGIEDMYFEMLELFCGKVCGDLDFLRGFLDGGDLHNFKVLVHGLKSSLATLGAMSLSRAAAELETASSEGRADFCVANLPKFLDDINDLNIKLTEICKRKSATQSASSDRETGDVSLLRSLAQTALDAADSYNGDAALDAIAQLEQYDFGDSTNDALKRASAALKEYNFADAVESLRGLCG